MATFGQRLRLLRDKKNLIQKQLADFLGVSESTVGKYENDQRTPPPDTITKLASYFEVSADYLLGITDIPLSFDLFVKQYPNVVDALLREIYSHLKLDENKPMLSFNGESVPPIKSWPLHAKLEFLSRFVKPKIEEFNKRDDGNTEIAVSYSYNDVIQKDTNNHQVLPLPSDELELLEKYRQMRERDKDTMLKVAESIIPEKDGLTD